MVASAGSITVGMNETIVGVDVSLVPARLATVSGIAVDGQGLLHAVETSWRPIETATSAR